jgi:hypothetical protein
MSDAELRQELKRASKLLRVSLAINVVVLLVNLCLAYALLVWVVDEPASVEGLAPMDASSHARVDDPRPELEAFFDRTASVLDRMARRHGANPAEFVPTQAQIEAAVETRTLHSDESQAVLQTLREGYDTFDISWPIAMPDY